MTIGGGGTKENLVVAILVKACSKESRYFNHFSSWIVSILGFLNVQVSMVKCVSMY